MMKTRHQFGKLIVIRSIYYVAEKYITSQVYYITEKYITSRKKVTDELKILGWTGFIVIETTH